MSAGQTVSQSKIHRLRDRQTYISQQTDRKTYFNREIGRKKQKKILLNGDFLWQRRYNSTSWLSVWQVLDKIDFKSHNARPLASPMRRKQIARETDRQQIDRQTRQIPGQVLQLFLFPSVYFQSFVFLDTG